MAALGAFIAVVFGLTLNSILYGWVFSVLWTWFAVPTFAVPSIPIPVAIGLGMIVGYLAIDPNAAKEKCPAEGFGMTVLYYSVTGVLRSLLVLGFGWIVHLFC